MRSGGQPVTVWQRARSWRPEVSVELLLLAVSGGIALAANGLFWSTALGSEEAGTGVTRLGFALSLFALVCAAHLLILLPLSHRRVLKPVLMLLIPVTVSAAYYMHSYTVFLDPAMLRNVLHTQVKEARELISGQMVVTVLALSVPPMLLISRLRIKQFSWRRAVLRRLVFVAVLLLAVVLALLPSYQRLSALMRNQHHLRYLVTPANLLVSTYRVLRTEAKESNRPRDIIDPTPSRAERPDRPRLLVLVLGETVRAQNWGLAGYQRQTTPELAQRSVVAFNDVTACGTSTEVSVPCMFSRYGRHDYDEDKIRSEESLLHLINRAGIGSTWLDNQTGCKGACDGLTEIDIAGNEDPERCQEGVCLDGVMFDQLMQRLATPAKDEVVVLHMLGNHGPAYWQRYPKAFARYQPECKTVNLADCSSRSITNSYDNAVLYTDHLLGELIDRLSQVEDRDVALVYLSDHGESLGEGGLYLHGVPYMIAPSEQLKVPMLWWFSTGLSERGLSRCLQSESERPQSHDALFHSVLGFFAIRSSAYQADYDLFSSCGGPPAPAAVAASP